MNIIIILQDDTTKKVLNTRTFKMPNFLATSTFDRICKDIWGKLHKEQEWTIYIVKKDDGNYIGLCYERRSKPPQKLPILNTILFTGSRVNAINRARDLAKAYYESHTSDEGYF